MEFTTNLQKEIFDKIVPWLKELFGESILRLQDNSPMVGILIGTAYSQLGVYPWGNEEATITTRSYVVTEINITPDLMYYLLRENDRMRLGAFGIDTDNDIFFEHTIVGSACDIEELRTSVTAVIKTADDYDDVIREKWGGKRAVDRQS